MLAKKRDGTAGLQVDTSVDMSRDYHKIRYRPYRQSNSLSSKALVDVNVADQPKEGYIAHSPNHVRQSNHQSDSNNKNNNNNNNNNNSSSSNNNNNNQGNDQYQNHHHHPNHHHHHHHHNHHHGSRLSRCSTHDIPDGRTSPAKVDPARRERRTMSNKRSNSLFTPHVTNLENVHGPGQPSAPTTPTASISSTPSNASTPTPLPVSPNTAVTVTPSEYGSDRRKMLIQQRRNNGQFAGGHGAIYTSSDVGNAPKVSGPSKHHFQPQHHGHSQPQQHSNYPVAVGNNDYYTCHSNGNGSVHRGSDRTPKGLKNASSLSKKAEKERPPEKTRPTSCSGNRDCPSRNGSFRISADHGNGFSDTGSVRGGGAKVSKKNNVKSGRGTPLVSEIETTVKMTDPTDPGGGQNNNVFSNKPYHNQQKNSSHYQQNEDHEYRAVRTNGKVRTNDGDLVKEDPNRGVNPLRSLMKWEYEDLYGHLHKTSGDRMTPIRPVRPKSAGVSARTHTIMSDSDDSSLDGDIEYVDLEELSDGEDAIVMTDTEVAAASSSLANSKQRVPKSWKDNSGVGIRRAYSMKDNPANSFANENSRHVNKISQEARRLRCNDSSGGKPDTKWIFAEKKTQHSSYQKNSRRDSQLRVRDSVDPPSSNTYHRHLNTKKDMFDLSSFKDNLSFSQTDSLAVKCKKIGNGNANFSVTGEQLAPESLRQLKPRQCGPEATESPRNEKGETVSRRNLYAPFPRRLKPLFGNIVEDSES